MAGEHEGGEVDWRRIASDRNVSIAVARGLWERARATAPHDPKQTERTFRGLLDEAAAANTTHEPGRETLVDTNGVRDAASLGPGKSTRVLDEQKAGGPAGTAKQSSPGVGATGTGATAARPTSSAEGLRKDLVTAAQASKNLVDLLKSSDPATIVDALREVRAHEGPPVLQKIMSLAGGAIERILGQRLPAQPTTGSATDAAIKKPDGPQDGTGKPDQTPSIPATPAKLAAPPAQPPGAQLLPSVDNNAPSTATKGTSAAPAAQLQSPQRKPKPPAAQVEARPVPSQKAQPKATTPGRSSLAVPTKPTSHETAAPVAPAHTPMSAPPAATPSGAANVAGSVPAVSQAHARERQRLVIGFDAAEARIQQSSIVQQAQLHTAGVTKANELVVTLDRRAATERGTFATARAKLTTIGDAQAALARSEAQTTAKRIRDEYDRQQVEAVEKATSEGDRMIAAARQAGASITRSYSQTKTVIVALMQAGFSVAQHELGGGDREVARAALHAAAESIGAHLQDQALADADELMHQATHSQKALIKDAWDLFSTERGEKVSELADAITASGDQLAHQFERQVEQHLQELAAAEQQYLSKLNQVKTSAAGLIEQSTQAMQRVGATANEYIGNLRAQRGTALEQLDAFAHSAIDQIHTHKPTVAQLEAVGGAVSQELTKAVTGMLAQAADQPGLDGVADRFRAAADVRIAKVTGPLEQAPAVLAKASDAQVATLTAQCAANRGLAQLAYASALLQMSAQSVQQLQVATSHWAAETNKFGANAQQIADAAVGQHRELTAQLPQQLRQAALRALANEHASWVQSAWDGLVNLAKGLVLGGAAAVVLFLFTPFTLVGAAIALGIGAVAAAFYTRMKALTSQWDGMSTRQKVDGAVISLLASFPDAVGVSDLGAAIFNTDTFTGRQLSHGERQQKFLGGGLGVITTILAVKGMGGGRPPGDGLKGMGKPPLPDFNPLTESGGESSGTKAKPADGATETRATETNENSSAKNEGKGDGQSEQTKTPDQPKQEDKPVEPTQEAKKDEPKPVEPRHEAKPDETSRTPSKKPLPVEAEGARKSEAGKSEAGRSEAGEAEAGNQATANEGTSKEGTAKDGTAKDGTANVGTAKDGTAGEKEAREKETGEKEAGEKEAGEKPKTRPRPRDGYDGGDKWPPPEPGPRPADPAARAEWRYKRYAYEQAQKGKVASELMSRGEYGKSGYATAAEEGKRPGRGGGKDQQATKAKIAREEGVELTENTKVGDREKPASRGGGREGNFVDGKRPNANGGEDLIEVDHIGQRGKPSARYRHKLAAQIRALGPNDTIELIDSKDPTRRIKYTAADAPEADTVVEERSAPKAPRKPSSRPREPERPEALPRESDEPPKKSPIDDDESE